MRHRRFSDDRGSLLVFYDKIKCDAAQKRMIFSLPEDSQSVLRCINVRKSWEVMRARVWIGRSVAPKF